MLRQCVDVCLSSFSFLNKLFPESVDFPNGCLCQSPLYSRLNRGNNGARSQGWLCLKQEVINKGPSLTLIESAFLWDWPPLLRPWPYSRLSAADNVHEVSLSHTICLPCGADPPLTPPQTIDRVRLGWWNVCSRVNNCRNREISNWFDATWK